MCVVHDFFNIIQRIYECADIGNGEYQPAFQQGAPGQPNYGATGAH